MDIHRKNDSFGNIVLIPELTDKMKDFIREHANEKPSAFALKGSKHPEFPIAFMAQQLKGRQKAHAKLPSWSANENVLFPASISMEQCTSEAVATFKQGLFSGNSAVDLTGGFGVDVVHLSESFKRVTYLERNAELAEIAQRNFRTFGLEERTSVANVDSIEWLCSNKDEFDLIYVDPARRDEKGLKVSDFKSCEPNILKHWDLLVRKSQCVAVKSSPGLDIQLGSAQLKNVSKVYVLSHRNECKELLFVCPKDHVGEPEIHCINLGEKGDSGFVFNFSEERALECRPSLPMNYLYEPNASIMKGGGFKSIANAFSVQPLHARTRLYTSDSLVPNFPGRRLKVESTCAINRKEVKGLFPGGRANIISRNCGLTPDELKKKLKLKDGGELYAYGTTLANDKRCILKCTRIES